MMISLKLSDDRKLVIDSAGDLALVSGLDAIIQNCETAMRTQLGEMYYNADEGIPTRGTLWDRYSPLKFMAAARTALLKVGGVTRILSITVAKSESDFTYSAEIETEYGQGVVTNG